MTNLLFLLLLGFTTSIQGQGVHDDPYDIKFLIKRLEREDSIERLPKNGIRLKYLFDTLPVYSTDEAIDWKDIKYSVYFYEDSGVLNTVHFFQRSVDFSFYYENGDVQKVCVKKAGEVIIRYYFTDKHNRVSFSEIQSNIAKDPELFHYFETLRMAKEFLERFQILFQERST